MATTRTDLFSVTRTLLRWGFYIDVGLAVLFALSFIGLMLKNPSSIQMAGVADLPPERRLLAGRIAVGGTFIASLLVLPVLRAAQAIVETARTGDPFVPENGVRLRRIGWLLLAINFILTTAMSVAMHSGILFPPVSVPALLTVLMIFVIARVFDTGSRMRSELQETV